VHTGHSWEIHGLKRIRSRFEEPSSFHTSLVVVEACESDSLASGTLERDRDATVHDTSARTLVEVETGGLPKAFKQCQYTPA
jgi:hypothetical protein